MKAKQEYTIVLITHNLRRVQWMVDYVGFIFLDDLVEQEEKECIFNTLCDERTRRYISGESFI